MHNLLPDLQPDRHIKVKGLHLPPTLSRKVSQLLQWSQTVIVLPAQASMPLCCQAPDETPPHLKHRNGDFMLSNSY